MKVKILKTTFWFNAGEIHDIDTDLAKQLIELGEAKAIGKETAEEETKIEKGANGRQTKTK